MGIRKFENKRWRGMNQGMVFRHETALKLINCDSVLDLGCGDGFFLQKLKENGNEAQGLDVSEEAVNKCRIRGLQADTFDFADDKLPFDDNTFDYVVMLDVLEHLYLPENLLKEAARVSREGVVLSVPNFNSLPARFQVLLGKVSENNTSRKGHIFWFNYFVLKNMARECGLDIEEMKVNVFWQRYPVIGNLIEILAGIFPNIFALSFVVKLHKIKPLK